MSRSGISLWLKPATEQPGLYGLRLPKSPSSLLGSKDLDQCCDFSFVILLALRFFFLLPSLVVSMGTPIAIFLSQRFSPWSLGLAREWGSPAAKWQTWCRCRWPRRRFGKAGIWKASLFVPSKSFSISLLRDPNTVELGDYFRDGNSSISMVQLFFFLPFC